MQDLRAEMVKERKSYACDTLPECNVVSHLKIDAPNHVVQSFFVQVSSGNFTDSPSWQDVSWPCFVSIEPE